MAEVMIWDPIERLFWGVVITLLIITTYIYIQNGRKRENKQERALMYGFSCLVLSYAVDRLLRYISEFLIKGEFRNFAFYGNYNNYFLGFEMLRKLAYISTSLGYIGFMLFTSKIKYRKINFLLSSLILVIIILIPFTAFEIVQTYIGIARVIGIFYIVIFFLVLTKWAKPELKGVSFHMIIAIALLETGFGLSTFQAKSINVIPLILPPLLYILATFIFLLPLKIEQDFFQKNMRYYFAMGSLTLGLIVYGSILYIIININLIFTLIITISLILSFCVIYFELRIIKKGIFSEIPAEKEILDVFSKPKKVTEEEVTISKEKKICLVCKGRVLRFNSFICECDTIYCQKCALALSDLENACWVCETPFDESKPVRLPEKEEEEIIMEEDIKKKGE